MFGVVYITKVFIRQIRSALTCFWSFSTYYLHKYSYEANYRLCHLDYIVRQSEPSSIWPCLSVR